MKNQVSIDSFQNNIRRIHLCTNQLSAQVHFHVYTGHGIHKQETGSKPMEKAGIRLRDNGVAPISRTRSIHGGTGKENEKSSKY